MLLLFSIVSLSVCKPKQGQRALVEVFIFFAAEVSLLHVEVVAEKHLKH